MHRTIATCKSNINTSVIQHWQQKRGNINQSRNCIKQEVTRDIVHYRHISR